MKLRIAVLALALLIPIGLIILRQPAPEPDTQGTQWVPTPRRAPGMDPSSVQGAAAERLQLDRRFTDAVETIHVILTGRDRGDVKSVFSEGRWHITYGDREVGSVSAVPGFLELEGMLTTWARTLARAQAQDHVNPLRAERGDTRAEARRARANAMLSQLDPEGAIREIDRAWVRGQRTAEDAEIAARALTLMSAAAVDRMGVADVLTSRALAALAIAEVAQPPLRRERALLAHVLGYDGDAQREASQLPAEDPVRAFVLRENATLETAVRMDVDPQARVLWLLRLASYDERDAWANAVEPWIEANRDAELLLLATGLAVDPRTEGSAASAREAWDLRTIKAGIARLTREGTGPGALSAMGRSNLVSIAERFERSLAALPATADGVFLDRGVLTAYHRAAFYSALARLAQPSYASVAAGSALASADEEAMSQAAGYASEFASWCAAMSEASDETGRPGRALLRLRLLRWFGAPAKLAVYDSLEVRLPEGDEGLERVRRSIMEQMDARPDNLRMLGRRPG